MVFAAAEGGGALHIPPFEELFTWKFLVPGLNTVTLVTVIATICVAVFWMTGAKKGALVPRGIQSVTEMLYNFIRNNIVVDVMGDSPAALKFVPFLATVFSFILFNNLFEVIPPFFFPPTSKLAIPMVLAITVWFIFNIQGIAKQGPGHYFKGILFPAGVPAPIYILLTPIEFVSVFLVRPFTLMIRLFANLAAGHVIVTLMYVFCIWSVFSPVRYAVLVPSFVGAVGMMGFEVFVGFIQAFVFTILTAVYIGESLHGH